MGEITVILLESMSIDLAMKFTSPDFVVEGDTGMTAERVVFFLLPREFSAVLPKAIFFKLSLFDLLAFVGLALIF